MWFRDLLKTHLAQCRTHGFLRSAKAVLTFEEVVIHLEIGIEYVGVVHHKNS
jgi:hypothetical protein